MEKLRGQVGKYVREWERRDVSLPAHIEIIDESGRKFTEGKAIIRNISLKGALVSKLLLKKQMLPVRRFLIRIDIHVKGYPRIGATARPVHLGRGREFELGVRFEEMWVKKES